MKITKAANLSSNPIPSNAMNTEEQQAEDLDPYRMTPEEEEACIEIQDEYDFAESAHIIAIKRGQIVVMPQPHVLQIDIDSDEQYKRFKSALGTLIDSYIIPEPISVQIFPSKRGKPHCHIYLHFDKQWTTAERLIAQQLLQDDPVRVRLNGWRFLSGVEYPSRLFEAKDFYAQRWLTFEDWEKECEDWNRGAGKDDDIAF